MTLAGAASAAPMGYKMARPKKRVIDFFPHMTEHGKTIYVLESQFGNNGYAFWFKLLEYLCRQESMSFNAKNTAELLFLAAKTSLSEDKIVEMLNLLAELDAIDPDLWETYRIVWVQNLIDNLNEVWRKRSGDSPKKPHSATESKNFSRNEHLRDGNQESKDVSGVNNPQSRVEESREKKRKEGDR